jgi:hypothetical protein
MSMVTSFGGWAISKIAEIVVNKVIDKAAQATFNKVGLCDATCEQCNTTTTAIVIPEGKSVPIRCSTCGHSGEVHIASLENLTIQAEQVQVTANQANITANVANIISQTTHVHVNGSAHFVGTPCDPSVPSQVIDAQVVPNLLPQGDEQGWLRQEIATLRERLANLESHLAQGG